MEAACTDHARIQVWVEEAAFPAAVDGHLGLKEPAGGPVLVDQTPACNHALGARGEVTASPGQRDGLHVFIESGL